MDEKYLDKNGNFVIDKDLDKPIYSKKENLKGGKADNMTLEQIAKKHDVPLDKLKKQFVIGFKIEKEHTKDTQTIKEIVLDHLFEMPDYYTKLSKIEKGKIEGKGEMKPEIEQKIIEFVKKNPNLDDSKFHKFVESLGIEPHEAEEVIYRHVNKLEKSVIHGGKLTQLEGHEATDLHYEKQIIEWFRAAKPFAWVQNKLEMYGVQDAEKYLRKIIDRNYDKIMN